MICPHCGGMAVNNGGIRAVCKVCNRSFNKNKAGWQKIKNNEVFGEEEYENIKVIKII